MKKILVAGMFQSGSTALFNLIRLCHLNKGHNVYSCLFNMYDRHNPADVHIVKIHRYDSVFSAWADITFNVKRDIRDCLASRRRRKNTLKTPKEIISWADHLIHLHKSWRHEATYEFIYEKYKTNPLAAIEVLAECLGLTGVDTAWVYEQVETLPKDAPQQGHHLNTLLSSSHVTNNGRIGGYTDTFSAEELGIIENHCGRWLTQEGYPLVAAGRG
ncbi:MAG: sulfotransferase domain-containing protein [Thermodesulfobacteriota bacterium]|nr:sulfotransferase domain-containing protein [Thermodesulfobacteriota bacterium]